MQVDQLLQRIQVRDHEVGALTFQHAGPHQLTHLARDRLAVGAHATGDVAVPGRLGGESRRKSFVECEEWAVLFDASASPEPTGLSFDVAADVEYSLDGVDFSYVPTPDADGFDAAVAFVRVTPSGSMNPPGAGGDPEFTLAYRARIR